MMAPTMSRETSLGVGLATAALVWGVYQTALPSVADVRVGDPGDKDVAAAERAATWTAAAVVAGVSLLAKDPTVFVVGGSMAVILAWWHRHANHYDATQGTAMMPSSRAVQAQTMAAGAGYSPAA